MNNVFALSCISIGVCLILAAPFESSASSPSLEDRIQSINNRLQELPVREPGETGGSLGMMIYHNRNTEHYLDTVTIDLGKVYPIDQIVLIPTRRQNVERKMEPVGFPERFSITGSEKENFSNPIVFYDGMDTDHSDPNGYPVFYEGHKQQTRFIRINVSKMPIDRGRFTFSLAEIFVFSDGRNVALKKKVYCPDAVVWDNYFRNDFLVDGQTSLGQPIMYDRKPSTSRGWHAMVQKEPDGHETLELHFEQPYTIEEIRLYPVQHSIWPHNTDYGFPIHFRLQVKRENADWTTVEDWSEKAFPRPGNSPVQIPVDQRQAQAIRLEALRLPQSIPAGYIFALAEMEVYAGGTNIAPQGKVISSSLHEGFPLEWNHKALVDGFSTRGKLISQLTWLDGLAERGRLESELATLVEQHAVQQRNNARILRVAVALLSGALVIAAGLMIYNRKKRQGQLLQLKNTIASDLHDEVGSNLASITILAAGAKDQASPESPQQHSLQRMIDIAKETSASMHDIVWMLHPDRKTNMSLTAKLQDIAGSLLADMNFSLADSEEIDAGRLSMDKLHHFILFYKEVLHNLAKHSQSRQVDIRLTSAGGKIRLSILDDGIPPSSGALPGGLQLRAQKMGGRLTYQTHADHNHLTLEIS